MEWLLGTGMVQLALTQAKLKQGPPLSDAMLAARIEDVQLKDSKSGKDRFYLVRRGRNVREDFVRNIVQQLTGYRGWSCGPSWCIGANGRRLELDIYVPELKLAVEVDGENHSKYLAWFHKTHENFEKQQKSDILKTALCKKNGVKLIRVPYTVPTAELEKYIICKFMQLKVL